MMRGIFDEALKKRFAELNDCFMAGDGDGDVDDVA